MLSRYLPPTGSTNWPSMKFRILWDAVGIGFQKVTGQSAFAKPAGEMVRRFSICLAPTALFIGSLGQRPRN
jgi:hypothetical protein